MRLSRKIVALLLPLVCAGAAQAGGSLNLSNERSTFGFLGAIRQDNKYLPGDTLFLFFDIENITIDPKTGKATYKMLMDVFDKKKGKSVFSKETTNEIQAVLGGKRLPALSFLEMGLDQPAGEYTLKLTVTDTANKASKSLDYKFVIVEKGFGLVRLNTPSVGFPGQSFGVSFGIAGMQRDSKGSFDLKVSMRVFDDKGVETLKEPLVGLLPKDLPEGVDPTKVNLVPVVFPIELTRPGRFRVELEAVDNLSKKKSSLGYSMTVLEAVGK
jgi:hypothetical protein